MAHSTTNHASLPQNRLGPIASAVFSGAGLVGAVLVAVSLALGWFIGWPTFFRSYLFAYMFVVSISLGALFFVMLQHCVKAGWSVTVRRIAEGIAGNLRWLWIFFIPVAVGMWTGQLYDWVDHPGHAQKYEAYLTPSWWLARSAIYLAAWALVARLFIRTSIEQDATGEVSLTRKMERWAPLCMLIYGMTQSFASIDWIMSLESEWFSTMFPVYFFAASCCGFFATLILVCFQLQRLGRVPREITAEHYHDLGKLLFAFGIVFWAYIAYSQYMLIWYASIPEEIPFYLVRQMEGWLGVSLLLLIGHFAAPFLAIISRHPKRRPATLAIAAGWMLFMAAVDIYWLTIPAVPEQLVHDAPSYAAFAEAVTPADVNFRISTLDFTCLLGLASLAIAGAFRQLGAASLIPEHDPRLHEAMAFENS